MDVKVEPAPTTGAEEAPTAGLPANEAEGVEACVEAGRFTADSATAGTKASYGSAGECGGFCWDELARQ